MELRYYLSTLARRKAMIVVMTLAVTLVSIVATLWCIPTSYKSSLFFTVSFRDDQQTDYYKYGNYYGNMAAIEFARTLSAWTTNPKLIDDVYAKAGVNELEDESLLGKLLGPISMNRQERANIIFTITSKSASNAERLVDALESVLSEKLDDYNTISATKYKINNPSKAYETKEPKLSTNIPVGIAAGLLLGILLAYLYEYFAGVVTTAQEAEELSGLAKTDLIPHAAGREHYSFLASVLMKHAKGSAVLAGVTINPVKYSLKTTRSLAQKMDGVVLVDANLSKRNLHTFVKGHRKMQKGHTDCKTTAEASKCIHTVEAEEFSIVPAGSGSHFNAPVIHALAGNPKSITLFHTQVPHNADLLTLLSTSPVILFVQLGHSKADDVRKLNSFYREHETHLVIIK